MVGGFLLFMGAAGDFAPGRGVRLPRLIPFPFASGNQTLINSNSASRGKYQG
jgi:hypothetical protein